MKNQAIFSSKEKSKKLKCCLLQLLFSALRVNKGNIHCKCYLGYEILASSNRYFLMEVALTEHCLPSVLEFSI